MWVCNLCRKQQEILTKSGEWFSGSGVRPGSLGTSDPAVGGEAQRDRKLLRSRSQAPTSNVNTNTGSGGTQLPTSITAAKGADTMPGSRSQSEPPREKYAKKRHTLNKNSVICLCCSACQCRMYNLCLFNKYDRDQGMFKTVKVRNFTMVKITLLCYIGLSS